MSSEPSRSSGPFDAALDSAATRILRLVGDLTAPVLLIDGRSGSGKTTLAALLASRWGRPIQVIALDDLYPGWDSLDAGVEESRVRVLEPRARGERTTWRRWDWSADAWAEEHEVSARTPLVVEGSGIVTPVTARLADLTVWLDSPDAARKARALARDGELYRPHWDRWAAQERTHIGRDRPQDRATLVVAVP